MARKEDGHSTLRERHEAAVPSLNRGARNFDQDYVDDRQSI